MHLRNTDAMRAPFDAELTVLAHSTRVEDVNRVVARLAAVVECMCTQIASRVFPDVRSDVVEIIRDVALHLAVARAQMAMHSDEEVDDAPDKTQTRVATATEALGDYVEKQDRRNWRPELIGRK